MRRILSCLSLVLVSFLFVLRAEAAEPAPAKTILNSSVKQAAASKKNVFVIFHASWCKWCKRLEAVLDDPAVSRLIEQNYVVTRLDVQERGGKKQTLENPGGDEIMKAFGGEKSGLPFYAVLDGSGKKIADSNVMPGNTNIGFPGSKEEIAAFENILKQTAPRLSSQQRAEIMKHFNAVQSSGT